MHSADDAIEKVHLEAREVKILGRPPKGRSGSMSGRTVAVWCWCGREHQMPEEAAPYKDEARRRVPCPTCAKTNRVSLDTYPRPTREAAVIDVNIEDLL